MDKPRDWLKEEAANRDLVETIAEIDKGYQVQVAALRERIRLLEREVDVLSNEGMLFFTYLTERRRDLIPEYVQHVYSDSVEEWTEGNPKLYVRSLHGEIDLSEIPETGDDFK